jgi:hypothetical protein
MILSLSMLSTQNVSTLLWCMLIESIQCVHVSWIACILQVTGYSYEVVLYKASQALWPFLIYCVSIWVLILFIHPPVFSGCTRDI